jgi:hypothetical protein
MLRTARELLVKLQARFEVDHFLVVGIWHAHDFGHYQENGAGALLQLHGILPGPNYISQNVASSGITT